LVKLRNVKVSIGGGMKSLCPVVKINVISGNEEILARRLKNKIECLGGSVRFVENGRPVISGISREGLSKAISSEFGKSNG